MNEVLEKNYCLCQSIKNVLDKKFKKHNTCVDAYVINSFIGFEKLLSEIEKFNNENMANFAVFRGVENYKYDLRCSLDVNNLGFYEGDMVSNLYNKMPEEFQGLSEYAIVAKMQHYGMPTRLLDFSRNPLVALWFACCNESGSKIDYKNDGLIYIWILPKFLSQKQITYFSQIMAHGLYCDKNAFDNYLDDDFVFQYFHFMNIFIEPVIVTPRERNQQSIFLAMPNSILLWNPDTRDEKFIDCITDVDNYLKNGYKVMFEPGLLKISDEEVNNFCIKVIVKSNIKSQILKSLSLRGISRDFLFPEIHNQIKGIKEKFICQVKSIEPLLIQSNWIRRK